MDEVSVKSHSGGLPVLRTHPVESAGPVSSVQAIRQKATPVFPGCQRVGRLLVILKPRIVTSAFEASGSTVSPLLCLSDQPSPCTSMIRSAATNCRERSHLMVKPGRSAVLVDHRKPITLGRCICGGLLRGYAALWQGPHHSIHLRKVVDLGQFSSAQAR